MPVSPKAASPTLGWYPKIVRRICSEKAAPLLACARPGGWSFSGRGLSSRGHDRLSVLGSGLRVGFGLVHTMLGRGGYFIGFEMLRGWRIMATHCSMMSMGSGAQAPHRVAGAGGHDVLERAARAGRGRRHDPVRLAVRPVARDRGGGRQEGHLGVGRGGHTHRTE